MKLDIEKLSDLLREAARAEILPRFRRLDPTQVRQKTDAVDLVTEADEAAERQIQAGVSALMPDALFIGEESVAADPGVLDQLNDAELAVLVDPVDGTANFAAGVPLFGVMMAVVRKGETIAGIIYDPMGDDWVLAERGGGAWMVRADGDRIRLKAADAVPVERMVGMASTSSLSLEQRTMVLSNLAKVRILAGYRCAAHEYRTMASGHVHYLMYNKLDPWDHAPGVLIASEAGAHVSLLSGDSYSVRARSGGILVAPDVDSWNALRRDVFTV